MAKKDDHLSNEVAVKAHIDETGLSLKAKSRALAAFDRLCGSLPDIPAAWLEGIARRIRAKNAAKEDLISAESAVAIEKALEGLLATNRLVKRALTDQSIKQANRDAVAQETITALKLMPPTVEETEDESDLDDDWLNIFASHAEKASSERLRNLWGRILAGEIRKSRSFSLSTLRIISELDQDIALAFQDAVRTRYLEIFVPRPVDLAGELLLKHVFLEEVGLLQEVNGNLNHVLRCDEHRFIFLQNGNQILRCQLGKERSATLRLIKISRAGVEIASIFPKEPDDVALRAIAKSLDKSVINSDLCNIISVGQDGVAKMKVYETLKKYTGIMTSSLS